MRMVIFLLTEWGIDRNNIRKEDFIPDRLPLPVVKPPDTDSHKVTISINGVMNTFDVVYRIPF